MSESLESKLRRVQSAAMSDEDALADIDIVSIIRDAITNRDRVAELEGERDALRRSHDLTTADLRGSVRTTAAAVSRAADLQAQLDRANLEIANIATACGYDSDDDPQAPKTLVDYVAEANGMALNECEQITTADREAAIRKLSRNSATLRGKVEDLREEKRNLKLQLDRATEPRLDPDAMDRAFETITSEVAKFTGVPKRMLQGKGPDATEPRADADHILATCTKALAHALYWPEHESCERGWAQLIDDAKDVVRGFGRANERIAELQALGDAAVAVLRHEPVKPRPMSEAPRDVLIRVFMDLEHDGASFTDCEGNDAPWAYLADGWLPASGGEES